MSEVQRAIRIGTRTSPLALVQARQVKSALEALGCVTKEVPINTLGDQNLHVPLYELGIQGVFTKALDSALLNGEIDIAVHSFKDVPTSLAKGLSLASVLERAATDDLLLGPVPDDKDEDYTVATSSLRRKAQWLRRYPSHKTKSIRGNVGTRIRKLNELEDINGLIMAAAAVDRMDYSLQRTSLSWMLPAPAQGAVCVVSRADDAGLIKVCGELTHRETLLCTSAERAFLKRLNGGCTLPCAAYATINDHVLSMRFSLLSVDGKKAVEMSSSGESEQAEKIGLEAADRLLTNGGAEILDEIRKSNVGD